MKIILLKDVKKLGKRYEIKQVSDGFARNYLIPKGLVKIADKDNLKWLKNKKKEEKERAEQELKKVGKLASEIDGLELEIPVRIGDKEQMFEKINQQKISKALKDIGYSIDKNQIELAQAIEQLGEYPIKLKFEHNLETEIKVIVVEQKYD